jgi:CRISPR-associated protein Csd1
MVKEVTDALTHLIQRRSHRLNQAKVMCWYDRPVPPEDDPLGDVFGDVPQDDTLRDVTAMERADAESSAKKLLHSIRSGNKADLADCNYFALTLSGNSGRVIVRDWMQGRFESLAVNIGKWFDDLSIISRDGRLAIRKHKFEILLSAVVRDLKDVPSPMVSSLWQCAISGRPIPATVAAQALARAKINLIKDDGNLYKDKKERAKLHARMGLLRAFLLRNSNSGVSVMSESVDDELNSPAYLCGRIMSLLASIQEKSLGTVGAGVVQRYYAAASATPALVLGRLVRTAQIAHLPKIDGGLRHHFESQLAELWTRMHTPPPTTLSLEEQTLFAMGFYQQQASRYKKSEVKNTALADASE